MKLYAPQQSAPTPGSAVQVESPRPPASGRECACCSDAERARRAANAHSASPNQSLLSAFRTWRAHCRRGLPRRNLRWATLQGDLSDELRYRRWPWQFGFEPRLGGPFRFADSEPTAARWLRNQIGRNRAARATVVATAPTSPKSPSRKNAVTRVVFRFVR